LSALNRCRLSLSSLEKMATVRRSSSVAARMIRIAISLRLRARSFFIEGISVLERLFNALRQQIHEALRDETVHPAGNFAALVDNDRRRDRGDLQYTREAVFEIDGVAPLVFFQKGRHQFAVIVKTDKEGCLKYPTLVEADRLAWTLKQVPGVQTTVSLADAARQITAGSFEGNPKWLTLNRNQDVLNYAAQQASVNNPDLFNTACSVMPVIAYLGDHRADTLQRVVDSAAEFAAVHSDKDRTFLLAAGSAGIDAATNIVVKKAWREMLVYVYLAVIVLCFITFRNWRAVVVAVVPLALTSILCEALMVALGLTTVGWAVPALFAALLTGLAFGGAGMAFSTLMRGWQDFDYLSTAMFAMFFFAGTFAPVESFPPALRVVVEWAPLTQAVELIRGLTTGRPEWSMLVNVVYLGAMAAVGLFFASRRMQKILCP